MGTTTPIRKVYDIPIEKPAPAKGKPLSLPAPDRDKWFIPATREPARAPVRQK